MPTTDALAAEQKGSAVRTVLVDTSLLIEQQKREKYARPVREALVEYRFKGISSYSKLEFKRAWLQRLSYIHSACGKNDARNVLDVQDWIMRRLVGQPYQRRRLQTCFEQLSRFLEVDSGRISEAAQLARLRAHCKRSVLAGAEAMRELATAELKGTGCVRADEPPRETPDGSLDVAIRRCHPKEIRCSMQRFFRDNLAAFDAIAAHIDQLVTPSAELSRMRDHIRKAQKSPVHLCSDKNCGKLADAIIAVDGQAMDVFAANNDAEWVDISSALGKTLVNPVRPP